jgi:hypothetical protein
MQLRSPGELLAAAKEHMLEGRTPATKRDWVEVVNFMAFNIAPVALPSALILVCKIYNVPLTKEEIVEISNFQKARRTA